MNRIPAYLVNRLIGNGEYLQIALLLFFIFTFAAQTQAQNTFDSGSTGADGAFAPVANQTLQVPESGVFNFTTVNVPSGVTIKFTPNSKNTPVTILASGNVTIAGTISVNGGAGFASGMGGKGGPGGWGGGNAGFNADTFTGVSGDGRGGGNAGTGLSNGTSTITGGGGGGYAVAGVNASTVSTTYGVGGSAYGVASLLPLMGGSGGGGGGGTYDVRGGSGGGGGGAILIASSGTITLSGAVTAVGGNGGYSPNFGGGGGAGSGGAIRLIATAITGTGSLNALGGTAGTSWAGARYGGDGGRGFLRAESYDYSTFNPNTNSMPINITLPNPVFVPSSPQVRISSIAGVTVPVNAKGSMQGMPDVVLPGALPNPVEIQIQAENVPTSLVAQVTVMTAAGVRTTYQSTALSGTSSSSTATASISLPAGMSIVTATLTVNLQTAKMQPIFIDGERINRIEVAANLGGQSETFYVTASGKRLKFPTNR